MRIPVFSISSTIILYVMSVGISIMIVHNFFKILESKLFFPVPVLDVAVRRVTSVLLEYV